MPITPKSERRYCSLAEYRALPEDFRAELVEGELVALSAPSPYHQLISGDIYDPLKAYLKGKACRVIYAPVDIYLNEQDEDRPTIVQPDLVVICDPSKLKADGYHGAPDLVIEILSPSNRMREQAYKYELYQKYGVREYWVISPEEKALCVYLRNDKGQLAIQDFYGASDTVKVNILDDCQIDLAPIFSF